MKKLNNYHSFGLIFIAIYLFTNHNSILPDILNGFCLGIGIVLTLIGIYAYNHDISKIRNYKMTLLKKYLRFNKD